MDKEVLNAYDCALCLLCRQSALLEHYETCRAYGIEVSKKEMQEAMELTKYARESFLDAKTALGFKGGLNFLSREAKFQGFHYSNNKLVGDFSNLTAILCPMAEAPLNNKSCFKHEVAVLLLTHYYFQKGKYKMKGYWRNRYRQLKIKIRRKKEEYQKNNSGK